MTRRSLLSTAAASVALAQTPPPAPPSPKPAGRIRQAVTRGVFGRGNTDFDAMCRDAARMGILGFDLIGEKDWPTLQKYGLVPTMAPGAGTIADALNRKEAHETLEKQMRDNLAKAAAVKAPNVITFSGNRKGMADAEAIDNCVAFLNRVKAQAEDLGVTVCMEYLNSKVNHKDYQFDRMAFGVEIMRRVSSPRVKILYDMYHVQIMEGDVIRIMRDNFAHIAHFHTAGNPGRHEMDDTQEMNYRGIARAIADLNFTGYVAHEYTPLNNPLVSLAESIRIFTV